MSYTPNGWINKIAVYGMLCVLLYGVLACNTVHRNKTNEWHLIKQDSSATKDSAHVVKSDSTATQEESSFHYQTGDSVLDSELEIVMQQQKDYANGTTDTSRLQPIIIKKEGDSYSIDAGGRTVEKIKLKSQSRTSKSDSTGTKKTTAASLNKSDSVVTQAAATVHHEEKKQVKTMHVEKKKTPWYLYAGIVVLIAGGLAFLIIRKKAKGGKKVTDIFS